MSSTQRKLSDTHVADLAEEQLLSTVDAADVACITEARMRQLANTKEIASAKKIGGRWLIPRSEAERIRDTPATTGRPRSAKANKAKPAKSSKRNRRNPDRRNPSQRRRRKR